MRTILAFLLGAGLAAAQVAPQDIVVSPQGPVPSLDAALRILRQKRQLHELVLPVTVWIRGGTYPVGSPITLGPEDSGPITFAAWPGEKPVFDAGHRIAGWSELTVNGVALWVADVSQMVGRSGAFRSLFADGQRRPRARLPKQGFYRILGVPGQAQLPGQGNGSDTFRVTPGEVRNWKNLSDVEVRVYHFWTDERMPIESVDESAGLVKCSRRSVFGLEEGYTGRWAEYFVENVFEALSEPGEWYLDKRAGKLYYVPLPGEKPATTEVVAAGTYQFLRLMGVPEEGKLITGVTFRGLTFRYSDWIQAEQDGRHFDPYVPEEGRRRQDSTFIFGRGKLGGTPQVAVHAPGVISLVGVHNSSIIDCTIEHVGFWGINLADGCRGNTIEGNTIVDMGGGGIKVDGADYPSDPARFSANNRITDNVIKSGGRVFQSAAGIVVTHGFGNRIAHNEISDLFQTGVSAGWRWAREATVSRDNLIEKNHIFHLGQKLSSDIGGVYLLGIQPGTIVRNNLIHDVQHAHYGGWGIYPDAASANVVVENNVVYDVSAQAIQPNAVRAPTNREIIVRNNIFAFSGQGLARVPESYAHKAENIPGKAATFERNIFIANGEPIYVAEVGPVKEHPRNELFISDLNLFWDVSGKPPLLNRSFARRGRQVETQTWEEWCALASDRHSKIADPKARNLQKRDFTLAPDSPAFELGFEAIDLSDVGPRPPGKRR